MTPTPERDHIGDAIMSEEIDRLRVKCTGSGEIEVCCHPDVDDQPIGHKDRECVLDTGQGAPGCDIATEEKLSCKTKCPFWKARPATTPEGLAPEEGLLLIDELTALRAQVSQLTADLEVACGALEQTADALRRQHAVSPGHKDNAKWVGTALNHVRATLSAIRKDGP